MFIFLVTAVFGEEPVHVKTSPSYDSHNAKACLMMTPEYISNGDNIQSSVKQCTSNGDVRDGRVGIGGKF